MYKSSCCTYPVQCTEADDSQSEDESEKELHDDSRDKEIY